jgi:hypothetical protein
MLTWQGLLPKQGMSDVGSKAENINSIGVYLAARRGIVFDAPSSAVDAGICIKMVWPAEAISMAHS